jgi:hypothetical protein
MACMPTAPALRCSARMALKRQTGLLVLAVDSTNQTSLPLAREALHAVSVRPGPLHTQRSHCAARHSRAACADQNVAVLVLATKQDAASALPPAALADVLDLRGLPLGPSRVRLVPCTITSKASVVRLRSALVDALRTLGG